MLSIMDSSSLPSAAASAEPPGDHHGQEARSQLLSKAIADIALRQPTESQDKSTKGRHSDREKFESVYSDADAIKE